MANGELISLFVPSVRGGGAERAMLVFGRELVRRGFRVDLVLTSLDGALVDLIPPGIRVVDLGRSRTLATLPKLIGYLRENSPKALFSTIMNANVVAGIAGRIAGGDTKIIVRESNAPVSTPKLTPRSWLTFKLAPLSYRLSHGVIAVSQGVAEELVRMDAAIKPRLHVVPTPVISEEVLALAEEPVDHPWFHDQGRPVIVSAGRLARHKGFSSLFRAFARLRDRVDARLVVLGEGDYRDILEAERDSLGLHDEIDLIGFQKNPFRYMARADLFVLASEYEGLPNVLVQAMALGAPIVSTDCKAGPAEILCHGKYGRLVPVGDIERLATAMEEALGEPRRTDAPRYARERYGATQATVEYLGIAGLA